MLLRKIFMCALTTLFIIVGSHNVNAREKVILCADMVDLFDDGVAMLLMVKHPNVEFLGVTTVVGNTWVETGTASAIRQLEGIGRTDIPVYCGLNRPTRGGRIEAMELEKELFGRGPDPHMGAGGYPQPESWQAAYREAYGEEPKMQPQDKSGVDFIIDTVKANPGEVTVVAIGTYNNLAMAIRRAPEIVPLIKRVVYMGGAFFCNGNVMPSAEFNIWMDPESARYVWRQPFNEQIIFPLDCCEKIRFTKERYDKFASLIKTEHFKKMYAKHWTADSFKNNPNYYTFVWDVLCAAYVIDPSIIVKEETLPVDVNDIYGPTYGETLAFRGRGPIGSQKARIVFEVDEKKVWEQVEELFNEL